jgi:two-component system OmpR family response regulator
MAHILVVEDDELTATLIAGELTPRGHEVELARDGLTGLRLAQEGRFDALTLDRMLPGLDGLSLVWQLRSCGITTPVLMISALSDVDERIAGLRAGGDDYLVKPFAPSEMAARIEVLLRRGQQTESTVLQVGAIRMDLIRRDVSRGGRRRCACCRWSFACWSCWHAMRDETISRQIIFEKRLGLLSSILAPTSSMCMSRASARNWISRASPRAIVTLKGEGYRLDAV